MRILSIKGLVGAAERPLVYARPVLSIRGSYIVVEPVVGDCTILRAIDDNHATIDTGSTCGRLTVTAGEFAVLYGPVMRSRATSGGITYVERPHREPNKAQSVYGPEVGA